MQIASRKGERLSPGGGRSFSLTRSLVCDTHGARFVMPERRWLAHRCGRDSAPRLARTAAS
eukprot:2377669-Pyramimonas_sp.AAC.1